MPATTAREAAGDGRQVKTASAPAAASFGVAAKRTPAATSASADLRFEPFWDRVSATELLVFGSHGHQCFGHYSGWIQGDGERVQVDGLLGWAEEIRNRW